MLRKESSIACHNSLKGCFSIWKWGCLLLKIRRPSGPILKYNNDIIFVRKFPTAYLHTKFQYPQHFYNDFASLLSIVNYGLSDLFPLLGYDFLLVLHKLVQAGKLLLLDDCLADCLVGFPL